MRDKTLCVKYFGDESTMGWQTVLLPSGASKKGSTRYSARDAYVYNTESASDSLFTMSDIAQYLIQ